MQKTKELDLNKSYKLSSHILVPYKDLKICVFPSIASWILIKNKTQEQIFNSIANDGRSVQELIDGYKEYQSDLVYVLTQIEAKQIETLGQKSIFDNKKLHLHLTNKCNLRCPHCYMASGVSAQDELTTHEVFDLIKDFKIIVSGEQIDITGGEPTLRKDFFEIVEFANSLGLEVNVYTNGTTWNEDNIKRLSRLDKRNVQISIDGFNEESNKKIRSEGSFTKSMQAIDLFVKNGVQVKVAVTPSFELIKNNKNKYISFLKSLIKKYGTDKIGVNISHELMQGRNLTDEEINSFKGEYSDIADQVTNEVIDNFENDGFVLNLKKYLFDSCGYGALNVLANGDFYFCDRIPDLKKPSGNVRRMDFAQIYKLMKQAEEVGRIDNFKPCCDCEIRYICGGGCRITQFEGFKDIEDIANIDFSKIKPRQCDESYKNHYYELMVNNNERFYK